MFKVFKLSLVLVFMFGCANSSDTTIDNNTNDNSNKLIWNDVPEKYNPSVQTEHFETYNIDRINLRLYERRGAAQVIYSPDVRAGEGFVRLYTVSNGGNLGFFHQQVINHTLRLEHYGNYKCAVKITNGEITHLEGKCYVRIEVLLPIGSEIEVSSSNQVQTLLFNPLAKD